MPVIYLTAYSDEPTLERARATKPYGYLLKPFSERELHASIQMVLERRRADVALQKSERQFEQLLGERTASLVAAHRELEVQTAERLKAEQALHQSQKMEAVGQLTGGIAHDFNNILTVILGNLDLIRRSGVLATAELLRALDTACRGAERAATLTNRLLAFARRQPLDAKPVNLNALVVGMSDMLRRSLGEVITVETLLAGGLWWTSADESQLENALLNLALNARDAMPQGGKLTIETANIHLDEVAATDEGEKISAGPYVVVAVRDTGIGMSKGLLRKVFEPFFTTKDIGQGTGLGLSQVYGFIKQSGGHVKIHSELDRGTSVTLYLPRLMTNSVPLHGVAEATITLPGKQNEVILIVEDDEDVRAYSAGVLRDLGYRVVEAPDGPTALSEFGAAPNICLLFTDVRTPRRPRRSPARRRNATTPPGPQSLIHDRICSERGFAGSAAQRARANNEAFHVRRSGSQNTSGARHEDRESDLARRTPQLRVLRSSPDRTSASSWLHTRHQSEREV